MVAKEVYDNNSRQQITWIIPLLTKYVTGFAKTVPNGTRIEIPFIAWHES